MSSDSIVRYFAFTPEELSEKVSSGKIVMTLLEKWIVIDIAVPRESRSSYNVREVKP